MCIRDRHRQQPEPIPHFALTNFHNRHKLFGIRQADRLSHVYIIGKTGVGKSTLLETLAIQDLRSGRGFALIDPHGDLVERVVENVPRERKDKVVYLNAPDMQQPYGYNPLRRMRDDKIPLAVSGMLETLKKLISAAKFNKLIQTCASANPKQAELARSIGMAPKKWKAIREKMRALYG